MGKTFVDIFGLLQSDSLGLGYLNSFGASQVDYIKLADLTSFDFVTVIFVILDLFQGDAKNRVTSGRLVVDQSRCGGPIGLCFSDQFLDLS
jgi:hypothetical protein